MIGEDDGAVEGGYKIIPPAEVAELVHEVVKSFYATCKIEKPEWADLPEEGKDVVIACVEALSNGFMENYPASPVDVHNIWMREMRSRGYRYGLEQDPVTKTHPSMVDYEMLDPVQRMIDTIVLAVVQFASLPHVVELHASGENPWADFG